MTDDARRRPRALGTWVSAVASVAAAGVLVSALAGAVEPAPAAAYTEHRTIEVFGQEVDPAQVRARLAALHPVPIGPELARCLARNDDLSPHAAADGAWQGRGAQEIVGHVLPAMGRLAGAPLGKGQETLPGGLLAWTPDPARSRLVMMLDPSVLDLEAVREELNRVAREAYNIENVRGPKVTVAVQEGCFTAAELTEARTIAAAVLRDAAFCGWDQAGRSVNGKAGMDSRIHLSLHPADRAAGEDLERRLGGRVAVAYDATSW